VGQGEEEEDGLDGDAVPDLLALLAEALHSCDFELVRCHL
jgi:hypothetical protein